MNIPDSEIIEHVTNNAKVIGLVPRNRLASVNMDIECNNHNTSLHVECVHVRMCVFDHLRLSSHTVNLTGSVSALRTLHFGHSTSCPAWTLRPVFAYVFIFHAAFPLFGTHCYFPMESKGCGNIFFHGSLTSPVLYYPV